MSNLKPLKIAIDLTWLKPGKTGGGESFIRNLLDGFSVLDDNNIYVLYTAKDNSSTFSHMLRDKRFRIDECNVKANNIKHHLLWLILLGYRKFKSCKPDIIYFPVYETPLLKFNKIPMVVNIHDIQAMHYPEYFSKLEIFFFKLFWQKAIDNSNLVITISNFCLQDIKNHFKRTDNIKRIYNPIVLDFTTLDNFDKYSEKYNINDNDYYYTVCSMHKHKNLISIVKTIQKISNEDIPNKLVISGVTGPNKDNLLKYIKDHNLKDNIIITDFVSNEERNSLIKHCNCFLFPSIFEGFGMPPVEAMMLGSRVITTKKTSIPEVTQNKALYVDNPFKQTDWIRQIYNLQNKEKKVYRFDCYEKSKVAKEYLNTFNDLIK